MASKNSFELNCEKRIINLIYSKMSEKNKFIQNIIVVVVLAIIALAFIYFFLANRSGNVEVVGPDGTAVKVRLNSESEQLNREKEVEGILEKAKKDEISIDEILSKEENLSLASRNDLEALRFQNSIRINEGRDLLAKLKVFNKLSKEKKIELVERVLIFLDVDSEINGSSYEFALKIVNADKDDTN